LRREKDGRTKSGNYLYGKISMHETSEYNINSLTGYTELSEIVKLLAQDIRVGNGFTKLKQQRGKLPAL
jgi:hypothetical protein